MQLKQFDMHTLLCLSLMMQHEPALRYGGGPPARWYWDRVWSFLAAQHISNSSLQNISASQPAFLPPSLEDRYFTPCLLQNTVTVSPCLPLAAYVLPAATSVYPHLLSSKYTHFPSTFQCLVLTCFQPHPWHTAFPPELQGWAYCLS